MEKNVPCKFIPLGGANQDDSVINPPIGAGGVSPFRSGDYRYALNTRIGSSRGSNFGDIENIKGTINPNSYYKLIGLFSNYSFNGTLTPWLRIDLGANTWLYNSTLQAATTNPFTPSDILYQPVSESNTSAVLKFSYTMSVPGFSFNLVFLTGTTIIGNQVVSTEASTTSGVLDKTVNINIPALCDGIGFQVLGNTGGLFRLFDAQIYVLILDSKPTGTEKVIGKLEDTEFQRIYEAVWNSEGNHTIRYFDPSVNGTIELLQWSGLNFESNYFVKMAKLDNWLAFTDRNNPPRLIDTDAISNLFIDLGENDFREFHISFHKWAPTAPAIPRVYYDNVTNNYEKLKNRVFHFSYRYIYNGHLKSRWSPISKPAVTSVCGFYYGSEPSLSARSKRITSIEVDIPGFFYDSPSSATAFNYFDHTHLKFKKAVRYIELAFRDGQNELWKSWKTIDMNDTFNRLQYFDGTGNLTPIPNDDFNQLFDTVPFKAGTVEAIDNRFVFGDCLDEETPSTGLVVTNVGSVVAPIEDWDDSQSSAFPLLSSGPRADLLRKNALSLFNFKDRCTYKVCIQWMHRNGWRSAGYTTDNWFYKIEDTTIDGFNKLQAFNFKLQVRPPEWAVGYQILRTNALDIDYFMYGSVNAFTPIIDDVSIITDQLELPQDVKNRIQQHFDNESLVDTSAVVAEIQKELTAALPKTTTDPTAKANRDPEAVLQLVSGIGEGNVLNLLKNKNRNNSLATKLQQQLRKTKEINILSSASRIHININNWYFGAKKTATSEHPLNRLMYNFKDGDRVRFVGSSATASPTSASNLKEYDVPIIEFTGKGIIIERPVDLLWIQQTTAVAGLFYHTIEVYTPKTPTTLDHVFYETGEWYPVLYPGTDDRVLSKSDFVYTNNNAVTSSTYGFFNFFNKIPFFYADCYKVSKRIYRDSILGGDQSQAINLSMNPDDNQTFGIWDRGNGRTAVTYRDIPISSFKKTMARYGGKIVEESFVNNLNNFKENDQFVYPSEYGRIRDLVNTSNAQVESTGSILLAIGEREAFSIYVNRTTLEDLSGSTDVRESTRVLGSYNTLLGSHGTLNPESISKYRGNVYWWDVINGSWVRYGRDGLTAISDYKKRNWFKELSSLLLPQYLTDEIPVVISEFDPFNMELVTFINHSLLPATFRGYADYKGDTFSEEDTRWKNNHSYNPERFAKMNNQLYGFKDGDIYQHEATDNYSTFYGVKYDVKVEPVFNDFPEDIKRWMTIILGSTDKWSVERVLSEYRGNKALIESSITLDQFETREDKHWASFRGNINTPNRINAIIEGDPLRSKAIQVLLKLDPSVVHLSLLHNVVAGFIESPKNG